MKTDSSKVIENEISFVSSVQRNKCGAKKWEKNVSNLACHGSVCSNGDWIEKCILFLEEEKIVFSVRASFVYRQSYSSLSNNSHRTRNKEFYTKKNIVVSDWLRKYGHACQLVPIKFWLVTRNDFDGDN